MTKTKENASNGCADAACTCTNCQCATTSHKKCSSISLIIGVILLSLSICYAGSMIYSGMTEFRSSDRTINVKGLAVKDVEADLAIWTLKHTTTGNNLALVQAQINANSAKLRGFLKINGIPDTDIAGRRLEVTDLLAQTYRQSGADQYRYIISEVITVRSSNVNGVEAAYQKSGELLSQNVSLVSEQNRSPIDYIFTGLNAIKPEMIAEATKSARESAEQFASDSGAKIGGIKYATQGYFQILPRDSENAYEERQSRSKSVRVVTTINFDIRD